MNIDELKAICCELIIDEQDEEFVNKIYTLMILHEK